MWFSIPTVIAFEIIFLSLTLDRLYRRLLKILGSFDALGSPISLVQNLGTGVKDLFYEPAKGITISPKEFGKGLGRVRWILISPSCGLRTKRFC
jgi:hypothetical protein